MGKHIDVLLLLGISRPWRFPSRFILCCTHPVSVDALYVMWPLSNLFCLERSLAVSIQVFSSPSAISHFGLVGGPVQLKIGYYFDDPLLHFPPSYQELSLSGTSLTLLSPNFFALIIFCLRSSLLESVLRFRKLVQIKQIAWLVSSDTLEYRIIRCSAIIQRTPVYTFSVYFVSIRRKETGCSLYEARKYQYIRHIYWYYTTYHFEEFRNCIAV